MDDYATEAAGMSPQELVDAHRSLWTTVHGETGASYDREDVHLLDAVEDEARSRGYAFVPNPESEVVGHECAPLMVTGRTEKCDACDGTGLVSCEECAGEGWVVRPEPPSDPQDRVTGVEEKRVRCARCGWAGLGKELTTKWHRPDELEEILCPKCGSEDWKEVRWGIRT